MQQYPPLPFYKGFWTMRVEIAWNSRIINSLKRLRTIKREYFSETALNSRITVVICQQKTNTKDPSSYTTEIMKEKNRFVEYKDNFISFHVKTSFKADESKWIMV